MTTKDAFEGTLKGRTVGQLNALLEGAVDAQDLGKTNQILAAFKKAGQTAMIDVSNLQTAEGACATLCRRVKSQALGNNG